MNDNFKLSDLYNENYNYSSDDDSDEYEEEGDGYSQRAVQEDADSEDSEYEEEYAEADEELRDSVKRAYDFLTEHGGFDPDDGFDGSLESFKKVVNGTKERTKEQTLQEVWNTLADAVEQDPDLYLFDYEILDMTDTDTLRELMTLDLQQSTNFSKEKIDRIVEASEKAGLLEEDGLESKANLVARQGKAREDALSNAKSEVKNKQDAAKEIRKTLEDTIEGSDTIKGKRKSVIRNFMINPVTGEDKIVQTDFNRKLTTILNDPKSRVELGNLIYEYTQDGGFHYDKIVRLVDSKKTTKYEEKIKQSFSPSYAGKTGVNSKNKGGLDLSKFY